MSTTIGSLFSGIGGLELGLERAGLGPVIWQAEQDPVGLQVLARHWPSARRYPDVREVDGNAERPDIICGGFPCQDISLAGTGAGLAGARSGLWAEYARIIRELEPRWVVVENVAALRGRGLDRVLRDLAACGYDATWDCIPAAAVGAPHQRDRIFVVARRVSDAIGDGLRDEPERRQGAAQACDDGDAEPIDVVARLVDSDLQRRQGRGGAVKCTGGRRHLGDPGPVVADRDLPQWPPASGDLLAWRAVPAEAQPAICRLANGLPDGLDWIRGRSRRAMLHSYGNAVVPAVARVIGEAIASSESARGTA